MAETPEGTQAAGQILLSVSTPINGLSSLPAHAEQDDECRTSSWRRCLPTAGTSSSAMKSSWIRPRSRTGGPTSIVDERRLADDDHE